MSLDVGDLTYVLYRLLSEIQGAADQVDGDYALPERQYITTGGAVYDCAQVSVSANQISVGLAGATGQAGNVENCSPGWNVAIELAIVRPARESMSGRRGTEMPSAADIEADAAVTSADVAVLTSAVGSIAGPGWDQYGTVPASIQLGETQGGLSASVLSVTLNLWQFGSGPG